jgi:hypothetical protein
MEGHKRLSVGLVHYPIVDKAGKIVATNVTNLDVHDIARACRVYGIESYYVINPMKEQLMFVSRLLDFWRTGTGQKYNHMRRTALVNVKTAESIRDAARQCPPGTKIVGTSARAAEHAEKHGLELVGFTPFRERLENEETHHLLLFGTGFGMAEEAFRECHSVLEPLKGRPPQDYRHLSVRSAVSICLDRLLGAW